MSSHCHIMLIQYLMGIPADGPLNGSNAISISFEIREKPRTCMYSYSDPSILGSVMGPRKCGLILQVVLK